jgi:hypothetical protein
MNSPVDIEPPVSPRSAGRLTIREIAMSFEISELMIQLAEVQGPQAMTCITGGSTKAAPTPTPAPVCTAGGTKAPPSPSPTCTPASKEPKPLTCIVGGSTKAQQELTVDAGADFDAVRAQVRDRLATA